MQVERRESAARFRKMGSRRIQENFAVFERGRY
jgi:hypothetical protein